MTSSFEPILTRNAGVPDSQNIDVYLSRGGYQALRHTLSRLGPDELVELVERSELRGRGGAGFPTGAKWRFLPKDVRPHYMICNADESEPGTFKDRYLMENDPHLVIEGCLLAAYAVEARVCYIYIRGEFREQEQILERALAEARERGYVGKNIERSGFDCELYIHRGAGSYECGEETALLESLEGKRGIPRVKPPYPASVGLFGCPTAINNVETLANLPHIVTRGADWYCSIGSKRNTGPKLYCLSGHVRRPGVYELPLGVPMRELIFEHGGGIREGHRLKAVVPGGPSVPVLTEKHLDTRMDFDSLVAAGSMLGSAGVIVMDETTCMVWTASKLMDFYRHESCGKCTPCREGTDWLARILDRMEKGQGRPEDIALLSDVSDNIAGKTLCPFGDAAVAPVISTLVHFREEYELHVRHQGCPVSAVH
jgi:NADH-quinone oxidoreductase subunit F